MAQHFSQLPIEATSRMRELVIKMPSAWILYTYLVSKRFRDTGRCEADLTTIMTETGLSRATVFSARAFLKSENWAVCDGRNWELLVGFGESNKKTDESNKKTDESNKKTDESNKKTDDMIGTRASIFPKPPKASQSLPKPPKAMHVLSAEVAEVFSYWQTKLDHPSAKLTDGRKAKIEARRRAGYTVEQIKRAIDGCAASPFHRGLDECGNRTGPVYDDLDLICRDDTKLEKFIAIADRVPALVATSNGRASPSVTTPLIEHNRAAVEQAKREMKDLLERRNADG